MKKKYGVSLNTLWSIMFIILLFFPRIFLENSFDKRAGAFKFVEICFSQLSEVKLSNLSFSNNDALFTKQSKKVILKL